MAIFVRPDLADALAFFADGVSGVVVEDVVKATRDAGDEAAKRVEATLAVVSKAAGLTLVAKPEISDRVTLSLREVQGNVSDQLTAAARLSDLVVFGRSATAISIGMTEAFVQVLVETDRPVLRTTEAPGKGFARRIAIGWDGKTAAAQAVSAAIPYLARADSVEILSIQRPPAKPHATEGLKEYLHLHGVEERRTV